MAADEEAHAEARAILDLEEEGGRRVLVAILDPLPASLRPALSAWLERRPPLRTGRFQEARQGPGLVRARLEFETDEPERLLQEVLTQFPPEAATVVRAGHQPVCTMRFVPCWPPGLEKFSPTAEEYWCS